MVVMKCSHVWDRISEYLDHSLDPAVRAEVENHLAHCEICSAILDSTRNVIILTADERTFTLPIGYSARLHARLSEVLLNETPDILRE